MLAMHSTFQAAGALVRIPTVKRHQTGIKLFMLLPKQFVLTSYFTSCT